jgi:hypothetical protein
MALLALVGCSHVPAKGGVEAYAEALEKGDLETAWNLTSPAYQAKVSRDRFEAAMADPAVRATKAKRLHAVLAQAEVIAPELSGRASQRIEAARAALESFLSAADVRRFSEAWRWLSSDLRARYTPSSLARDFSLAPDAGDRLRRAHAAAEGAGVETGDTVSFPIAEGRAVKLVEEADGFRVAALE